MPARRRRTKATTRNFLRCVDKTALLTSTASLANRTRRISAIARCEDPDQLQMNPVPATFRRSVSRMSTEPAYFINGFGLKVGKDLALEIGDVSRPGLPYDKS
jgi:hypothetical protein